MIGLWGEITLVCALLCAMLQGSLPIVGYYRRHVYLSASARPLALAQCVFISASCVLLMIAFVTNDFSIAYVADNSHPALPFMYRVTALWGAHEGSILWWIFTLNIWTVVYANTKPDEAISSSLSISILGIISFSFLCFLLLTSNPFSPAALITGGHDLNPLLQDPGFVIHPPMLYAGYVGFSVAFAITLAALLQNKCDAVWAETTHLFAVAAWGFLTLGIMLGSWWAYRVLGWGGFWFWDPVENASLLPWLSGTALIHVLVLAKKRGVAKAWAALLALITFTLSLLGTFLVRSGVLVSVHTFANDPRRGMFLLLLLAVLITASLIIYMIRIPTLLASSQSTFPRLSRERGLLLNSAFLITAMLTILLGTIYPLLLDALHLGAISVGAPYFNTVMMPLVLMMMFVMGLAVQYPWQEFTLPMTRKAYLLQLWTLSWKKIATSMIGASLLLWYFTQHIDWVAWAGLSLSFWIVLSVLNTFRISASVSLAHFGFAVLMVGILLSSLLAQEKDVRMKPGDATQIGPYQFFFVDAKEEDGSNYRGIRATFDVFRKTHLVTKLYPEKRIYVVRDMVMTKADIHPGLFRDLYIALGEPLEGADWSVRLYYKPFIRWIWLGGIIMIFGAISAIVNPLTRKRNLKGRPS